MVEQWRAIKGYEVFYEVSNLGQVRSHTREFVDSLGRKCTRQGRILRPGRSKSGHYTVALYKNKKAKSHHVHKLVAAAFLGPCPQGSEVSHGPNGVSNNSVDNLSYETRSQNSLNRRRDGTIPNARPVRRSDGVIYSTMAEAAEENNVYSSHIHNAIHGTRGAKMAANFEWEYAHAK